MVVVGGRGRLGSAVTAECRRRGITVLGKQAADPWPEAGPTMLVFDAGGIAGLSATVAFCQRSGAGLVYAVSGVTAAAWASLKQLADTVPVVLATNLSLGHWLQSRVGRWLASTVRQLDTPVDASVWERHPRTKQQRPSASATELAEEWAAHSGAATSEVVSLRSGHAVSEHALQLDWAYESLSVRHDVRDLRAAAAGAMLALGHAAAAAPGLIRFDTLLDQMFLGA